MFTTDKAVFVLVDVQGKLADIMHERDALFDSLQRLTRGMQALKIPLISMEQSPEKMGPTIPALKDLLTTETPVAKTSFSGCANDAFLRRLTQLGRQQVILAGIEAHVCVYQTALDLIAKGYQVEVVTDAVSSRTLANKQVGLERMKAAGAGLTSVESILFELLRSADHPAFRDILRIVK